MLFADIVTLVVSLFELKPLNDALLLGSESIHPLEPAHLRDTF